MSSDADQPIVSYNASCHCGKLKYTVKNRSLSHGHAVMSCNCSICTRNAYLLVYPKHEDVTFQSGYDDLISFVFGKNKGLHKFCSTCGCNALADFPGDDCYCINIRMFSDIVRTPFELTHYNGKANTPHYSIVSPPSKNTSGTEDDINLASYQANCQCAAVIFVFNASPIPHCDVVSCTCSICSKKGYLMVHSDRASVVFQAGEDRLRSYFIADENASHKFCAICGSGILVDYPGRDKLAINIRILSHRHIEEFRLNPVEGEAAPKCKLGL